MNIQGENKTQNRIFALLPLWVVIGIFMIGPLLVMAVVSLMESNVYGCLLYTSPSPRDKRQSRMPSSA